MQAITLLSKIRVNPDLVITNIQAFNGYEDFILMFEGSLALMVAACVTKVYTVIKNKRCGAKTLNDKLNQIKACV